MKNEIEKILSNIKSYAPIDGKGIYALNGKETIDKILQLVIAKIDSCEDEIANIFVTSGLTLSVNNLTKLIIKIIKDKVGSNE